MTKRGENLLRGLALAAVSRQNKCVALFVFIPDKNLIQSRNMLCNRVIFVRCHAEFVVQQFLDYLSKQIEDPTKKPISISIKFGQLFPRIISL